MSTNADLCIPTDYVQRSDPTHFDDRGMKDTWQNGVYAYARGEVESYRHNRVLDYGCGSGYKLMKYFSGFDTVGYELEPSLSYLRETYPLRLWIDAKTDEELVGDLLICSDVIEHVPDAIAFVNRLKKGTVPKFIFSTPTLEILNERGLSPRMGPPNNTSHVREWTTLEFRNFISMHFHIIDQVVINCEQGTQLILAERQ